MGALTIELRARTGPPMTERLRAGLVGPLAGRFLPALILDGPPPTGRLLDGEVVVPELFATRFRGRSLGRELVEASAKGRPVEAWVAIAAALPLPGEGRVVDTFLRFLHGLDTPDERLLPIAALHVAADHLALRLGENGAPLVLPPSRDRGGPIDQRWAAAIEANLAELCPPLVELGRAGAFDLSLSVEGLPRSAAEPVARRLNARLG